MRPKKKSMGQNGGVCVGGETASAVPRRELAELLGAKKEAKC